MNEINPMDAYYVHLMLVFATAFAMCVFYSSHIEILNHCRKRLTLIRIANKYVNLRGRVPFRFVRLFVEREKVMQKYSDFIVSIMRRKKFYLFG